MTSGLSLQERVARLEAGMENLTRQISREIVVAGNIHDATERSIARLTDIVERQDARQDRIERILARILGGLAVVIVLANFLAPVVLRWLGVEGGP